MRLQKKTVLTIVGLTGFSLLGLVAIQIYLLLNTIALKQQAFKQNVSAALANVVAQLENHETLHKIASVSGDDEHIEELKFNVLARKEGQHAGSAKTERTMVRLLKTRDSLATDAIGLAYVVDLRKHLMDTAATGLSGKNVARGKSRLEEFVARAAVCDSNDFSIDTTINLVHLSKDSLLRVNEPNGLATRRRVLIEKIIDQLMMPADQPIQERINRAFLDSLVTSTVAANGIETECIYGVVTANDSTPLVLANRSGFDQQIATSKHQAVLFPNDILVQSNSLSFYFPGEQLYLLRQLSTSAVTSLVFIAVIVGCFVYVIRMLFKQRDFAQRLTNFINNMVHEFKTPISTIALAGESLARPKQGSSPEKVQRYSQIIRDENFRMREQVEKILQMAVLEEGDFELSLSDVDVHELLNDVVQRLQLQSSKRKGQIQNLLLAKNHYLKADRLHLANIFHNLLDNAIKYSKKTPKIVVETIDASEGLVIRIRDNGIGLNESEKARIFDKYYRVPTGNLHDVRGFGLGLSYVKLMTEAHNGEISVESKPNEGTTFTLTLKISENC